MDAIPAVLILWPQIAERVQTIRIPRLAVIGQVEIGKIDFTYEILDEFQDWYESRTGSRLEDLAPELIEKIQTYIYSILDAHWDPAKITAALWSPQETIDSLPLGAINSITKREDGAVFWLGRNFIGTYNKLVSEQNIDTEYLLSVEDAQEDDVIFLLNQLGSRIDLEIEGWGSDIPELDFTEIAQIIENELLEAEDAPPYYTEAPRRFTPKHAWELPLTEVKRVLYSDDVTARRPLLLDLWPEFVVQIPSGSPDQLHSLIYHEYHTGERGLLRPEIVDEDVLAKRHQRIAEKMKPKLEIKTTGGRRSSTGVTPRLRPVGHSRLGTGELTLIRLSEATTQQVRKNHPEVMEKLEQPIERLAEECIIKLLQAQIDILDIVENATKMICKKAR